MEFSEWVVYTVAEVLLVLTIACLLLFLQTKGLKALISSLQGKLTKAIGELREAKGKQASTPEGPSYTEQIAVQIQATEKYHAEQDSDLSIEQDITAKTPKERLVAAMRYRFLRAEQDGLAEHADLPDWPRIALHYDQLPAPQSQIDPQPPSTPETALKLSYDEQRDEIERFKRLFTTMERQWQIAKAKAQDYYNQLLSLIGDSSDPTHLTLKKLAQEQIAHIDKAAASINAPPSNSANRQDVDKLKAINERQKNEIAALQDKLANASTDQQRLAITADFERQLAQQQQFMKESEVCIDLLERELEAASRRIEQLEAQKPVAGSSEQNALLKDKHTLNKQIQQLRSENEQLVNLAEHAEAEQRRLIAVKNKEVEAIKGKFAELAKRYKALANTHKRT
ncbi:hypothetical protein QWY82_15220 [Simiduia curdlanivorans]|uniref:Chromosome partition protein Smc n=1 Tax=Simiduia curdlanivorans TaxID=1492769 RepID=A0ABV8V235_9GAMM|nr:hypothetical protein [Simiduia curdlanivorans]MDN3640148.1 hypothetical protein [Simiduia curdlanivorans]